MSEPIRSLALLARTLWRRPGYSATVIATLALGIGASTSIFSILYGTVLRPLPYPQPERLVRVRDTYVTGGSGPLSIPNFVDMRAEVRSLEEFVAYNVGSVNLATEEAPLRARSLTVTANFFDGLGVEPALGRGFLEGEDRAGASHIAIISDRVWRERFDGRPDVLGRTLEVNAEPYSIVGVLPASFWFPGEPQLVLPYSWDESDLTQGRGNRQLETFARLPPGVSREAAETELRTIFNSLQATYPGSNMDGWSTGTYSIREWMFGYNRRSLRLLTGGVLLVLLIGCVNVANLMLVRAERRQREIAVRAAIGAGRGRIIRDFLSESLALSIVASVLGVALAWGATKVLIVLFGGNLPRADQVELGAPVVAFAVGLALLTGLLVGLAPALRTDTRHLQDALREGAQGVIGGGRLQRTLVAAEVALAVLLAAGAGLLLNSFWHLNRVDTGIDPEHAFAFRTELPAAAYESEEEINRFYRDALERIGALPGVRYVGITDRVPLLGGYNITTLASPADPEVEAKFIEIRRVTPGFFPAAGIPLLQGRMLTEDDGRRGAQVVVISDVLARTLFPDGDAVGQRIDPGWNEEGYEVVGVVGSVREFGAALGRRPALYWPFPVPSTRRDFVFVVRTAGADPLALLPAVRRAIGEIDPDLPLYGIITLEDAVAQGLGNRRFATALFAAFGGLALALAGLGIFGVLAFSVEQRTREVGIRVALGARGDQVARMVVGQGMRLVAVGLAVGVAVALAASRVLSGLLFEVEPTDPLTLAGVVSVAAITAFAASYLPARRAARIDPMEALRRGGE